MLLSLGEEIYRLGLQAVGLAYRKGILKRHRLGVPVVSVGNLTWGGTGKTPLVIYLARAFEKMGRRVAVLTRGYGRDESALMTDRLHPIPVLVGPDRIQSGRRAVEELGADLLLLDDGYQQWRVIKDFEILAVDSSAPFGNGHLIPRGSLREPASAAARADLFVIKKGDAKAGGLAAVEDQLRQVNPQAPIFRMGLEPTGLWRWPSRRALPLDALKGRKLCTLAALAAPGPFESTVAALGGRAVLRFRFRDHHPYTVGELVKVMARCRQHDVRTLVTTAKDAIRIPKRLLEAVGTDLKGCDLLVLEVAPRFEPDEGELLHRIRSVLAGQGR